MKKLVALLLCMCVVACSKVPLTQRNQMNLLPEGEVVSMSLTAYNDFLKTNKVVESGKDLADVERVSARLIPAVEEVLKQIGCADRIKGYKWDVRLVKSNEINAWCMPGGKIVVYTGILPYTKNDAGLAVILGYEIAHAIARHGNERMSQSLLITTGYLALDAATANEPAKTRKLLLSAVGVGATVGVILPFSRLQESEADRLGLIFMAAAGYDPHEAIAFWQRMSKNGSNVPEFLRTHPSDKRRIEDIEREYITEAMPYYHPERGD